MSLPAILSATAALENVPANKALLGINHAYDEPPEALDAHNLPVAVRYSEGAPQMSASRLLGRYNIYHFKIEVHFPRGILQEAVRLTLPCIRAYQNLYAANLSIRDPATGLATCDVSGFREPAFEGPVLLSYKEGAPVTLGVIFYMWAKEMLDPITVNL